MGGKAPAGMVKRGVCSVDWPVCARAAFVGVGVGVREHTHSLPGYVRHRHALYSAVVGYCCSALGRRTFWTRESAARKRRRLLLRNQLWSTSTHARRHDSKLYPVNLPLLPPVTPGIVGAIRGRSFGLFPLNNTPKVD